MRRSRAAPATPLPSCPLPVAQAQAQINAQAQAALSDKMISVCVKRCLSSPADKLSDKQRRCLESCTSAFLEGFGVAAETFASIAKRSAADRD